MARALRDIGYEDQYDPDPRRRALLDQMPDPQAGSSGAPPVASPAPVGAPRAPSTGPLPPSAPSPNVTYPEQRPSGITPVETPTAAPATPAGWDQTKWADPTHQTTKYEVGRILAKYPPTSAGLQQAWAEIQARFPGTSFNGKDTISGLPGTQGPVDVLHDASTGGSGWGWRDQVARDAAGDAPGAAGNDTRAIDLGGVKYDPRSGYQFGYTGGQLPTEIANFYTTQTQAIQRQQQEQAQIQATMRDALLRMMAQGQEPVDMTNDPGAATYRNAARREQRQGRDALAERAAFLGLNSGGQGSGSFESAIEGQEQDVRRDIAGYEANRATTELQNRRGLLVQALQMAQALGARTEATDLQRELAQLDAQLRQQQLGFGYAGLGQQQGQFEDSMGFNYANLLANLNRGSYLDLMG